MLERLEQIARLAIDHILGFAEEAHRVRLDLVGCSNTAMICLSCSSASDAESSSILIITPLGAAGRDAENQPAAG
jgi:hypothetical protein